MSSPHLESFPTIPEAIVDLWPLIQENNSSLVLEPSMFHCQDQGRNVGRELLSENRNVHRKHDKVDQWPFPRGNSSSPPTMDSVLVLEQKISAVLPDYRIDTVLLQKELQHCHPNSETSRLNYPIDDSLSASREDSDEIDLLGQESSIPQLPSTDEKTGDINDQTDLSLVPEQESSALAESSGGKGLIAKRAQSRGRNYRFEQGLQAENKEVQADKGEESAVKKQEHNAKERIRSMKLHASYLALGALLPDSSRSKKKKSSPRIIDRAVEYIPEMGEEIEKLTLRKNDMLSTIKKKQLVNRNPQLHPSVSVHEIRQGEFIVQICTQGLPGAAFSNLLHKVEEEGMCLMSASTLQVSDDAVCYHLQIQVKKHGSCSPSSNLRNQY